MSNGMHQSVFQTFAVLLAGVAIVADIEVSGCDIDNFHYCVVSSTEITRTARAFLFGPGELSVSPVDPASLCEAFEKVAQCAAQTACSFTQIGRYEIHWVRGFEGEETVAPNWDGFDADQADAAEVEIPLDYFVLTEEVKPRDGFDDEAELDRDVKWMWINSTCINSLSDIARCFNDSSVRSGLTRCRRVALANGRHPFSFESSQCRFLYRKLKCEYGAIQPVCGNQTASAILANMFEYESEWTNSDCPLSMDTVIAPSSGLCDEDSYHLCASGYQYQIYTAWSFVNQPLHRQLSSNQLQRLCSAWHNFTICANNSGCTFGFISTTLDYNDQQTFNATVSTNDAMCNNADVQDILACVNSSDVQSRLQRCRTSLTARTNYPYYIDSNDRREYMDLLACNYNALQPICNGSAVYSVAKLATNTWWQRYDISWLQFQTDEEQLVNNYTLSVQATACDYDIYFECSANLNIWSTSTQPYMSQLASEQFPALCRSWMNFTNCVNKSRCSFGDVYNYTVTRSNNWNHYAQQFRQKTDFFAILCSQQNQDLMHNQSCLMSRTVQANISRCDSIARARRSNPYNIDDHCIDLSYTAACYAKAMRVECDSSVVVNVVASFLKADALLTNIYRTRCSSLNASALASSSTVNGAKTCDEFFYCHSKWNVLSYASSNFQQWSRGLMDTSTADSHCSSWGRFTECVNNSGCSYDTVAGLMQTYYNSRGGLNSSVLSMSFMCSRSSEYAAQRQCNMMGRASQCDDFFDSVSIYPLNQIYTNSCRILMDMTACVFTTLNPICGRAASLKAAQYRFMYYSIWSSAATCNVDEGHILTTPPVNTPCSMMRYASCLAQLSSLRWMRYHNNFRFSNLLDGSLTWTTMTSYCADMNSLTQCVGCRADDDNFPSNAFGLDRYMDDENNYLTPRRLNGLCAVSIQNYTTYSSCFRTTDVYSIFLSCQSKATTLYPSTAVACRHYTEWARCFYDAVSSVCSVDAAKIATDYLLNAWPTYLNYTYGCNFVPSNVFTNCNGPTCMSPLSTATPQYITALQTGQITDSQLTQLCTLTSKASKCLKDVLQASCPAQPANYYILIGQVFPFVCDPINMQQYPTYQQCYKTSSSAAQSTVNSYFRGSVSCATSKSLLASLYSTLNASCGPDAAASFVTYTSHLRTVRTLSDNITDNCANVLYPMTDATPRFLGPFYTAATGPTGPYKDYYFTCQVNYTRPVADDGARFDVILTSNGQLASITKTTTSQQLDVMFTSQDLIGFYGTEVSCMVRSYWELTPSVRSQYVASSASYFVGIKYWTDMPNSKYLLVTEATPLVPIYFQATVPVPCDIKLKLQKHTGLLVSDCSIKFSAAESPLTVHTLNVRAVPTPGSNSRVLALSFEPVQQSCAQSPWRGYKLRTLSVLVNDYIASSTCSSDLDPRIFTFDRRFYSVYFAGDFLLWKSFSTIPVEVHVRHQRCFNPTVSCNCAVAFREGNNVLGVYACDPRRPPIAIRYLTDYAQPASDVLISADGLSFTITMPSGRYIRVSSRCATCQVLSIVIYPISEDISRSTGLCGNYNGIPADDTIPRGSKVPDYSVHEPVIFAKSFMLKEEESLINGHKYLPACLQPTTVTQPQICDCRPATKKQSADECSFANLGGNLTPAVTFKTYWTDRCSPEYDIIDFRRKREATASSPQSYVITPDDLPPEDPGTPPDAPLHPDADFSNVTGYNASYAWSLCERPLQSSSIYARCSNYTNETKEAIIEGCSLDVQMTGSPDSVVQTVLARFSEACLRGIQESDTRSLEDVLTLHNETTDVDNDTDASVISNEIAVVLESISHNICPGQPVCNGNGYCQNSTCYCFRGYIGVDCSLREDTPPTISELRYGTTCIVQNLETCSTVSLFVRGISFTESFTCKVVLVGSGETYYTSYQTVSAGEVQCQLPASPADVQSTRSLYMWSISVSNNNKSFSSGVELFVYDSKCLENCDNVTLSCQRKADTCSIESIGGKCYLSGEASAKDPCKKCNPQQSATDWTEYSPGECITTTTTTTAAAATTTIPSPSAYITGNGKVAKLDTVAGGSSQVIVAWYWTAWLSLFATYIAVVTMRVGV